MAFFDPPELPSDFEPGWAALPPGPVPPENVLGMPVAARAVLVQRDDLAVAVLSPLAFPGGLHFRLVVKSRRELVDDRGQALGPWWSRQPGERRPGLVGEVFRFGVLFADGRKASSLGLPYGDGFGAAPPAGPVLVDFGGGGDTGGWSSDFWLWPLPPPGPLTFVCEWPWHELEERRASIDAGPIRAAAEQAIELWPETADGSGRGWTSQALTARSVRRDRPASEPPPA